MEIKDVSGNDWKLFIVKVGINNLTRKGIYSNEDYNCWLIIETKQKEKK